nr:copia protein [Tanacetum cinerariifolium]
MRNKEAASWDLGKRTWGGRERGFGTVSVLAVVQEEGSLKQKGMKAIFLVVVAGTNSTNFLGTKEAAGQDVKKDVSSLRYIILSNWFHEAHLESSTIQTACLTNSLKPSSDTRLIFKRVTSQDDTPSLDNILTLTNKFEDILGVTTNTDDTNGVEADLGNMETIITASPTPTLRIHKDHPKRVRPIGTKWVLMNKKDERGIVIRNKARLVAQRHTQEERIDYDEVFTPIARIEAIRLFLAYPLFMRFTVYQMDVKSADMCTNSTNFLGTKEAAGQDVKKDVSSLRYIVLPNWFHEAHLKFEDILGVTTNTDDINGVEADLGNMETIITASPTPTLRIYKDHPKSQIIGHVDTPIQTRNKSKEMDEQSFIATIHQKTNPDLF